MHSEDSRENATSNTDEYTPLGTRSDAAAAFEGAEEEVGAAELVWVTVVVRGVEVEGFAVAVEEAAPFAVLDRVALPVSVIRLLAVGAASPLDSKLPDCAASLTACWKIWVAFAGTRETKPMRGGATAGGVRFP